MSNKKSRKGQGQFLVDAQNVNMMLEAKLVMALKEKAHSSGMSVSAYARMVFARELFGQELRTI